MTAILKYNFKKSSKFFKKNNRLYSITVSKNINTSNTSIIKLSKRLVIDALAPSYSRNALRKAINKKHIGVSNNIIYSYVKGCFSCQSELVLSSTPSLTSII
ncbi:hypothetical protein CDIK_2474 [Cucumispora dikerogammari]|nr:hypothetical protein CDIK_2474 [Cucumispora dikerogammari]